MDDATQRQMPVQRAEVCGMMASLRRMAAGGIAAAMVLAATPALAGGELHIYNWGNYTSPEMMSAFEKAHDVKVTITDYDSGDAALAKIRTSGHGFDIVVAGANFLPIFIQEGLVMESRPDQMSNFKNVDPRWVDVAYDPGRHYSVPWNWGLTGILVDSSVYSGEIDSMRIILDPPPELKGKIAVLPDMNDVMYATIRHLGGKQCTDDRAFLGKVRDTLVAAKKNWLAIDFGIIEKIAARDIAAAYFYNGAALIARESNPNVRFGYPAEGFAYYMDSAAVLTDAKNVENAKLFLDFLMKPESAAMLSNTNKTPNGIRGSEAFMDPKLLEAPEMTVPAKFADAGEFLRPCPPAVNEIYTQIWNEVLQ